MTEPEEVRCMTVLRKHPHLPHQWEPHLDFESVRCPGYPFEEEPKAQVEGRVLGLSDNEVTILHTMYQLEEQLNGQLAERNTPYRWRVLASSDPRLVKKSRKVT